MEYNIKRWFYFVHKLQSIKEEIYELEDKYRDVCEEITECRRNMYEEDGESFNEIHRVFNESLSLLEYWIKTELIEYHQKPKNKKIKVDIWTDPNHSPKFFTRGPGLLELKLNKKFRFHPKQLSDTKLINLQWGLIRDKKNIQSAISTFDSPTFNQILLDRMKILSDLSQQLVQEKVKRGYE